jgi:hypothetical protein
VTENERRAGWELHRRDALGEALTDSERIQLGAYREAVEAEEAVYLRPANQRVERRLQYLEQRNTELAALVTREEVQVRQLEATLKDLSRRIARR